MARHSAQLWFAIFVIVNPQKSQSPTHGGWRRWCLCVILFNVFLFASVLAVELKPVSPDSPDRSAVSAHKSIVGTHKFRISDPELAREAIANGAELIEDYGSFQIFRADSQFARVLAANSKAEDLISDDIIALHAAHINTTTSEAQALRKPVALTPGKRLHLIQFAGPPKPEWRAELEKSGVSIVSYIPHNAYLLYGTSQALQQMQSWAAQSSFVQWEGQYLDDYKIHPSARTTDSKGNPRKIGTDMFAVQLVADDEANPASLQLIERLKLEPIRHSNKVLNYLRS